MHAQLTPRLIATSHLYYMHGTQRFLKEATEYDTVTPVAVVKRN